MRPCCTNTQKEESADEASGDETVPATPPQDPPAVEIPGVNPAGVDAQPAAVMHPVGEPAVGGDNPPATENIADEPPVFVDGAGTVRRAARSRTTSERQRTLSVVSVHAPAAAMGDTDGEDNRLMDKGVARSKTVLWSDEESCRATGSHQNSVC